MTPLRDNLHPYDFADAECRRSAWSPFPHHGLKAVRVWVCRVGRGYWFQRHEWQPASGNSTHIDDWIFSGFWPMKKWPANLEPVDLEALHNGEA